ncbi:MAG: zinc-ribbon domain-containing protein [Candidatus Poseidoniaceae archaeon]
MGDTHPLLILEAPDELNPDLLWYGQSVSVCELPSFSNQVLTWRCTAISKQPCNHEWKAKVLDRSKNKHGCPACAGKAIHIDGRNSLARIAPDLAGELVDESLGFQLRPGSNKRVEWECKVLSPTPCNHRWVTSANSRYSNGRGCPVCAGQAVHIDKRNAMAVTHPELAAEFISEPNGLTPWDMLVGSNKKGVMWECRTVSETPCNHQWIASPNTRSQGKGCPSCAGQTVHSDGRNNLTTLHPKIAAELIPELNNGLNPDELRESSNKRPIWKCLTVSKTPCGHEWETDISHRTLEGTGCPACSGRVPKPDGSNSLAVTHPELSSELEDPELGRDLLSASSKIVGWVCRTISDTPCGHHWSTTPASRTTLNSGCPSCMGRSAHSDGRNSLLAIYPKLSEEIISSHDPSKLLPGSNKRVKWKCTTISNKPCGYEWTIPPVNRTTGGSGCPVCANSGFDPSQSGYYYVHAILNEDEDVIAYKGGISGDWERRFKKLQKGLPNHLGLRHVEHQWFERGYDARELETTLLRVARQEGWKAPQRDFDGGNELFLINPLERYREIIATL